MEYDSLLIHQIMQSFALPDHWQYCPWNGPWDAQNIMSQFTVWMPPPEIARQLIVFILEAWVEQPLTTRCLIIVPRTLSHAWAGLSRHLTELGTWKPRDFCLRHQPVLPIPFVVLHLAPHMRCLPVNRGRLDNGPIPWDRRWHEEQAEIMRGLQGSNLPF